ncbi:hypothetical protein BDZ88DRAFT_419544 [Geranomyces variabilis]|nr:hypothetical protein BDZ88DRAFT_419544 [Geranomyces variabilis]
MFLLLALSLSFFHCNTLSSYTRDEMAGAKNSFTRVFFSACKALLQTLILRIFPPLTGRNAGTKAAGKEKTLPLRVEIAHRCDQHASSPHNHPRPRQRRRFTRPTSIKCLWNAIPSRSALLRSLSSARRAD